MKTIAAYIPHGGGPLPLLGDPAHERLTAFLTELGRELPRPDAIVVISAHFENPSFIVTGAAQPGMIYDYYGFPAPAYEFDYPAPGAPSLAKEISEEMRQAGFPAAVDPHRGYDHGTFVPLMLMYPGADIPVTQLSLNASLDPSVHLEAGRALAAFKDRNLLILGSGMSFHNMRALIRPTPESSLACDDFHHWLVNALTNKHATSEERLARLAGWTSAPSARFCHPREEHLLPLHVCAGYGEAAGLTAEIAFDKPVLGHRVIASLWR